MPVLSLLPLGPSVSQSITRAQFRRDLVYGPADLTCGYGASHRSPRRAPRRVILGLCERPGELDMTVLDGIADDGGDQYLRNENGRRRAEESQEQERRDCAGNREDPPPVLRDGQGEQCKRCNGKPQGPEVLTGFLPPRAFSGTSTRTFRSRRKMSVPFG